jgi:hypothetical protein
MLRLHDAPFVASNRALLYRVNWRVVHVLAKRLRDAEDLAMSTHCQMVCAREFWRMNNNFITAQSAGCNVHKMVYYCMVHYCMVHYCMVHYCMVYYCMVHYCMVYYCMVYYYPRHVSTWQALSEPQYKGPCDAHMRHVCRSYLRHAFKNKLQETSQNAIPLAMVNVPVWQAVCRQATNIRGTLHKKCFAVWHNSGVTMYV